jgi:20S proteasome subunit beta 4
MDTTFGFTGKDFVILGCDRSARFSIVRLKDDEDKILALDGNKLLASAGEIYDRNALTELIQRNMHLYYYRHSVQMTTHAAAHYIRNTLAESIRQNPYQANLLLAGVDESGPSLYYIDYLGTLQKLSKAAQGYASHFLYGLMDNLWRQVGTT